MEGKLYVCATPIGNLEDITQRVLQTLRAVDLIAAEDTRHTKKLLNHYGIHTPLISYHQHNERERSQEILQMLRDGKQIALVSDAGTPAISDPGQILVRRCRDEGLAVTALPGPCALITALSMSGWTPAGLYLKASCRRARESGRRCWRDWWRRQER